MSLFDFFLFSGLVSFSTDDGQRKNAEKKKLTPQTFNQQFNNNNNNNNNNNKTKTS